MIEVFLVCQVAVVMVIGFVALKLLYEIREALLDILADDHEVPVASPAPIATPVDDEGSCQKPL